MLYYDMKGGGKMATAAEVIAKEAAEKERWKLLSLMLQVEKDGGNLADLIVKVQAMTEAG